MLTIVYLSSNQISGQKNDLEKNTFIGILNQCKKKTTWHEPC